LVLLCEERRGLLGVEVEKGAAGFAVLDEGIAERERLADAADLTDRQLQPPAGKRVRRQGDVL